MTTSTFFALMAEFGTAEIPLENCCEKFFGLSFSKAKNRAAVSDLPVPAYRGGSQKSPWLISASDLAPYLDQQREEAKKTWAKMHNKAA